MKRLTVTYDGRDLFDGEIQEFNWTETGNGIKVEGKIRKSSGGGAAGGILEMLASASKKQTAKDAEIRRDEYEAEKVDELEEV